MIPFLVRILIGYLSAEIAIRRSIRNTSNKADSYDRLLAIQYVNRMQGRDGQRYPFP
jgi:hypothetical protein